MSQYFSSAKIQALKRSVPKGDKKKKKEIAAEIALLEAKLDEKHDKENKESAQNYNEVGKEDFVGWHCCLKLCQVNIICCYSLQISVSNC